MRSFRKYNFLILLCAVKFVLPYLLEDRYYQLQRDEYLYLEQGNHLAWGFMEVPPMLALQAAITQLLGAGFFWVKFWPSLFGALTLFIAGRMTMELGGKKFSLFLLFLSLSTAAYLRVNFLFQANSPDIFFWTLTAWFLFRYINSSSARNIYFMGIAIGVGFMSKYSMAFFAFAVVVALALTSLRVVFFRKEIYLAALIALLIFAPNIYWQFSHNFPVVHHMKELSSTQLESISAGTFLKEQLLMNLPAVMVLFAGIYFLFFAGSGNKYHVFGLIYLVIIVVLLLAHGKGYYALGVYPMLFAFGAYYFEKIVAGRKWLAGLSVAVIIILAVPIIPAALAIWKPERLSAYYKSIGIDRSGILKWEDGKDHPLPQDFADMLGWKELAEKVETNYLKLDDSTKKQTLIYCRNYGQAGAITYYGRNSGLPQITSDNASFLLWMPDDYQVKTLMLVASRLPGSDDAVFQEFSRVKVLDSITDPFAREYRTKIYLYEGASDKVDSLIKTGIHKMKSEFSRQSQ